MPIKFNKLLNENRYIGGPFDVESLVENLLGQLAGNQAILVNVYDMTNASDPLIMYGDQNQDGDMSLLHESELDFGDSFRKHKMICRQVRLVSGHYLKMCQSSGSFLIEILITLNSMQISSESIYTMDSTHHRILSLCDWFISRLYLIWCSNSHC